MRRVMYNPLQGSCVAHQQGYKVFKWTDTSREDK